MTELEKKIKAKIPGEDTGIEVKHHFCAICTGNNCGVDCYVKDGKIIHVEGTPGHPNNNGHLCVKGAALRDYVYRKDRVMTPLKRVGERGEGKFEPISWDEAYAIIAEKLNAVKEQYSPHSVAFMCGYTKWFRPFYHRFVHAFGSINFSSDDCNCYAAKMIADRATMGYAGAPDQGRCNTFLGWNYDGYYSRWNGVAPVQKIKDRGGKVIIIDIRETPATKYLADKFLKIKPGTDGALALGMAKIIIDKGWADMDFIEKYTFGFEQYKALVDQYPLDKVAEITGLDPDDIMEVTEMYACNGPAAINVSASAQVHRINGFNAHRAIMCLTALTGNYDRAGGQLPGAVGAAATYARVGGDNEEHFRTGLCPKDAPARIGGERFPLWEMLCDEGQGMDLGRQLKEGTPYPIKAVFALGLNAKMYPETNALLEIMKDELDFFVNVDPFMTVTSKYADIVLPCCTSVERPELKAYAGGKFLFYGQPVIEPLGESKHDVQILFDLAKIMKLDDEWLGKGDYEACLNYMIDGCGLTIEDLKKAGPTWVKVPNPPKPSLGTCRNNGFATPSGKFEFYSNAIASIDPKYGLDPLPSYYDPVYDQNDPETKAAYPFYMVTGARMSHAVHSRTHAVPWLRSIRPDPLVEVYKTDAEALGLKDGDKVFLTSPYGEIPKTVKVTSKTQPGLLLTIHGYDEANVCELEGRDRLDPYSGYPAHKGSRVNIRKA